MTAPDTSSVGGTPTPPEELERQIMSSTVPKNEREWWAADAIEALERRVIEAEEDAKISREVLANSDQNWQAEKERGEALERQLAEEREQAASTIKAWFDLSKTAEDDLSPVILDGLKGYLRTAKNGGMPTQVADAVEAVVDDFCHLYLGNLVAPILVATEAERDRLAEAMRERCAQVAEGPIYREVYRGTEGHNWATDGSSLYGRGRVDAAAAIRALPTTETEAR